MSASKIIKKITNKGFRIQVNLNELLIKGPKGGLSKREIEEIKLNKSEIIALINFPSEIKVGRRVWVDERPGRVWEIYPESSRVGVLFDDSEFKVFVDFREVSLFDIQVDIELCKLHLAALHQLDVIWPPGCHEYTKTHFPDLYANLGKAQGELDEVRSKTRECRCSIDEFKKALEKWVGAHHEAIRKYDLRGCKLITLESPGEVAI